MTEPKDPEGWQQVQEAQPENLGAALDDIFKMDTGLDSLSRNVDNKRRSVTFQSRELEALEAQLRAAEERLQKAGLGPSSASPPARPVAREIQAQILQRPETVSEEEEEEESSEEEVGKPVRRDEAESEEEEESEEEDESEEDESESDDEHAPVTSRVPLRKPPAQPHSLSTPSTEQRVC
ncbi:hypothetical protein P152DRAFT_462350 [Eremomyces bilateralis CBS 781.70]|uniref:Uncharacterized protein n=1 Tax=Eremomyces bilateralis CBS 781.70 TaxID=1392243 RepID=A0A6G1FSB5_9PEZI|nr:uncharacterized protein P152DRAFT_462350 [Eremomyces bilateralis CBS 781.70]KAF1808626.1 hypothetical protein P152DRAFT_462350 [Eremomyces bilateralis CBS 781.70]